jgi:hypothetical protein
MRQVGDGELLLRTDIEHDDLAGRGPPQNAGTGDALQVISMLHDGRERRLQLDQPATQRSATLVLASLTLMSAWVAKVSTDFSPWQSSSMSSSRFGLATALPMRATCSYRRFFKAVDAKGTLARFTGARHVRLHHRVHRTAGIAERGRRHAMALARRAVEQADRAEPRLQDGPVIECGVGEPLLDSRRRCSLTNAEKLRKPSR